MPRLVTVANLAVDDAISEAFVDALTGNVNFLTVAGADVAALGVNNGVPITAGFQRVTVATGNIDNITDAAGLTNGEPVKLLFTNAQTLRNNGGGVGNIRTLSGADRIIAANEIVELAYDGVTAVWREVGGNSGSMKQLYDSTLGAPAASFDVPGISQAYTQLEVVLHGRTDVAGASSDVSIRLNNDSAANYDFNYSRAVEGASVPGLSRAATSIFSGSIAGGGAGGNRFGCIRWIIPYYTDAVNYQEVLADGGFVGSAGAASSSVSATSGIWVATAAVTRITLFTAGNFVAGSRLSIYGVSNG
jgi:hypothetical protein